ncbi:uncharacterized protein LOC125526995 [Triticum urartu]|uniref:uncharacterized protein LOC125526995 n=1 Tax=Triticum urartu TaxID=4572 RepID=UPI0020441939|nr:uncharacterized protein LOC125526995 [Triticum urartu]
MGASGSKNLDPKEWKTLTLYILTNLQEVRPYIDEFIAQFSNGGVGRDSLEEYELLAGEGDGNYGFISWFREKGTSILDKELKQVANGFDYKDFYRCEDGKLEEARAVVNKHCPKLVHNLMHEARPLAVRKYMATQGYKSLDKKAGRRLRLEKDKYMEVTPRWCVDKGECWERIVDYWCSKEYRAKNKDYRNRRAAMLDPPHHQGNLNVMEFGERWASHHNAPLPNLFVSYALAHKAPYRTATPYDENDTASAYSSKTAYDRMEKFKGMAKELKGCHILTSPCIRVLHHV